MYLWPQVSLFFYSIKHTTLNTHQQKQKHHHHPSNRLSLWVECPSPTNPTSLPSHLHVPFPVSSPLLCWPPPRQLFTRPQILRLKDCCKMQWHTTTIPPASPEYTTAEGADNFYTLPRTPSSLAGSLECALVYSTLLGWYSVVVLCTLKQKLHQSHSSSRTRQS